MIFAPAYIVSGSWPQAFRARSFHATRSLGISVVTVAHDTLTVGLLPAGIA